MVGDIGRRLLGDAIHSELYRAPMLTFSQSLCLFLCFEEARFYMRFCGFAHVMS